MNSAQTITYAIIILLLVHCVAAIVFLLLRPSGSLKGRREYILPVLLVPLFGPLLAVTIELLYRGKASGSRQVEMESLKLEQGLIWDSHIREQEDDEAVPLEEAVLLNDIETRRKVLLKTFQDDPFKYLDVLMVASHNEDVDTTHYATIQISKIRRNFQLELQKYARAHAQDPNNLGRLNEYIKLLGQFLDSPLPEESILRRQRRIYDGLLDEKLALIPNDLDTLLRKLRNLADQKENYPAALETIRLLQTHWPGEEQTWIESLRAFVEWQDTERLQQVVNAAQSTRVEWTKWGREQVRPWVQV